MTRMRLTTDSSVLIRDQFKSFLLAKKAYGTADKTLATYEQHFSTISKHLDVNKPIDFICKKDLQKMIADIFYYLLFKVFCFTMPIVFL